MFWRRFTDILLGGFFLLSVFYFVKNLFLSDKGIDKLKEYQEGVSRLKALLQKEEEKNRFLKEEYDFVKHHPDLAVEAFAKNYLGFVAPNEAVLLCRKNETQNPTYKGFGN